MYRDTVGKVTAGIGFMLPDVAAALRLPFYGPVGLSSVDEVTQDYNRVSRLAVGMKAAFYETEDSPRLRMPDMLTMVSQKLVAMAQELQKAIPGFDGLRDPVKTALLDMEYNMGLRGLESFHHMLAAVESGDFKTAAKKCIREAGKEAFEVRNAWTQGLFAQG